MPPPLKVPSPTQRIAGRRHRIAVLAFDGMSPFETAIVVEVFGLPRPELEVDWYELAVCAAEPGPLRAVGGLTFTAPYGLDVLSGADTLIVPGVADVHGDVPEPVLRALRSAHARGARLVSICSGAFALAAAGVLDDRVAATHWQYAPELARRFPRVRVDPDVLYVDGGDVLTSAGSAAGLDLCLHLIRVDHGAAVANAVARRLVIPPHRHGDQAQFIEAPVPDGDDDRVARSMSWALAHLDERITVPRLAREANMSTRSYLRHFARRGGTSPIRWLIGQRVRASLALLETSDRSVEQIATAVGFDSAVTYRHHFARAMHTSPSAYRRGFHREQ